MGLTAEQLAQRKLGIGSSDAPKLCAPPLAERGEADKFWGGPLDVYLDKLGLASTRETPSMNIGNLLEDDVASLFEEETGLELFPGGGTVAHPDIPYMLATPDRRTLNTEPAELKTCATFAGWGPSLSDEYPAGYLIQTVHQMVVLGVQKSWLAVLLGGQDFRYYRITLHAGLVEQLLKIEADFWERVQTRNPPAPDWTDPRTPKLLTQLHPPEEGKVATLDGWAQLMVQEYEQLGQEVKERDGRRDEIKARLLAQMGPAALAYLPDGRKITRKPVHVRAKTSEPYDYFSFTISKPAKGKK